MVQVWGNYQRLEFGGLSLLLSLSENHYRITDGDRRLDRIGYDRIPHPDLMTGMFYGYSGASHTEGPAHPTPYQFNWQLNNLAVDDLAILRAMMKQSHLAKAPMRLFDSLISLGEPAPRTRAKVGAYEEIAHGLVWFFPIFDVWIHAPESPVSLAGRYSIQLEGQEWSPDQPLSPDEDALL